MAAWHDRRGDAEARRPQAGGPARSRRLVVSIPDHEPDQLRIARPRLSWRGSSIPITTSGVIIGRDGEGAVTATPQDSVVGLVEVVRRGSGSWIRVLRDGEASSVGGEVLGTSSRLLVAGDKIVVAGEEFRFSADVGVGIGAAPRRRKRHLRPPRVERTELRVSIVDESGDGGDVVIDTADDTPLLSVLLAAAECVRASWSGAAAGCDRMPGDLDLGRPIGSAGLLWGDRIVLRARRGPPQRSTPDSGDVRGGRIPVNRAPRIRRAPPGVEVELPAPPEDPGDPRFPFVASLLPLVAGIAMAVLLRNAIYLIFTALSPIMAVTSYAGERRSGRSRHAERAAKFQRALAATDATLSAGYVAEGEFRFAAAPGLDLLLPRAIESRSELWERRRSDDDFLRLRAGIGSVPFSPRINFHRGGSEALRADAHRYLDRFQRLDGVPVALDLAKLGVLGIAGPREPVDGLVRGLILQATLLHSPADLLVAAALSHRHADAWWWMKWLPHVIEAADLLNGPPLASGNIAAAVLLEQVRQLQETRLSTRTGRLGGDRRDPHLLLLIDGEVEFDRAAATSVLEARAETDVTVLWLASEQAALPLHTEALIEVTSVQTVNIAFATSGERIGGVQAEPIGVATAAATARALAPLIDRGARRRSSGVPTRVGLLELLELEDLEADAICARWERQTDDLAAPIGAGSAGALEIDLRRDGPHALVVGTTGSGKSELLRSIVCALAAVHPPTRVSFLLFDYKGGAAFGPCRGLPHVFDVVSDLDEHLSQRALIALDAELLRRERILAEVGAKDMVDLARKFPSRAPPALVLAVDEFAKLRDEVPDFVDGVVDVAQRGRSLGVHMILASQTLGNAFTTPIRANTNLRLALRSSDEAQSEEAIGSREAAHIPSGPEHSGRGFARIGLGRVLEFQTAYVSGRSALGSSTELRVRRYELDGGRMQDGARPAVEAQPDEETDLERLVGSVCEACEVLGILPPPPPWLPPLPAAIRLGDLPAPRDGAGVAVGLVDDPREQRQPPLAFSPAETGFLLAIGAGGSGRTTLLRTFAAAIAGRNSPSEQHLYIIEARGRGLAALNELPHCGAVISANEEERIDRLLGRLVALVGTRSHAFSGAGASTLAEYRRRVPDQVCPQITLLIDDLDDLVRAYDSAAGAGQLQRLGRIVTAGRQLGVAVIATAASRAGVGSALMTHVARRIVLRMPSPDDAIGLGVETALARTIAPDPGRAVVDGRAEMQVAHVGESPDGGDQIVAIRELAAWASSRWPATGAPSVGRLPDRVGLGELPTSADLAHLIVGVGGDDLLPVAVDLTEGHVLVSGARRSGRSLALLAFVHALSRLDRPPDIRIMAHRRSPLHRLADERAVASDPGSCTSAMTELAAAVAGRTRGEGRTVVAIIDDAGDLADAAFDQAAERVVRGGPDVGVHVIAAVDRATARGFTHPWVRVLANDGRGIVLAPEDASAADHLGGDLPRRSPVPRRPGRGYLVRDGSTTLLQIGIDGIAPADASH